ncbi:hypothetical protein K461DRAFT_319879 [Myriangium duriaei CBS 260.36]|uniref:AB hydrolase-1 domain-containing protein n=1 Tax=Myriangium duriaei CBS 260.36 TaxID=1168546 RepID=A0A9P4J997_9PEZI|nr:hypothetical protein K461DRAFT_319879 [Myriangium duriaei CBS 260.36]
MRVLYNNPWEHAERHEELVSIGSHALYASAAGRPRSCGAPVAIFIAGAGAPIATYIKLQDRLGKVCHVLFYDRAGYDQSTLPNANSILAEDTAKDLDQLLRRINVQPPWILIAHSFGGIIARHFLSLQDKLCKDNGTGLTVVGMILLDCATELMLQHFPHIPSWDLEAVGKSVDFAKLTHLQQESGFTDAEWMRAICAIERTAENGARQEDNHGSGRALAEERQLECHAFGQRPLSVVRLNMASDYKIVYDAGVKKGDGTSEEQARAREFIKEVSLYAHQISRAQLDLSTVWQYTFYKDYGHDGPLRKPDFVEQHLRWVFDAVT